MRVAGKRDSEVVTDTVEHRSHVIQHPNRGVFVRRVPHGFENIKSAVTRMTVRCEIQRAVFVHVRVHLVRRRVDPFTQGLHVRPFVAVQLRHPYVLTAFAAGCVTHEIERVAGCVQRRMTHGDRTIGKQFHFLRLTPFAAGAFAAANLGT